MLTKFEEIQTKIEAKPTEDEEAFAQQLLEGEAKRKVFELSYYQAAGQAQSIIDQELIAQRQQNLVIQQNTGHTPLPRVVVQKQPRHRSKLPEIKLPEFGGKFTKWMFFKDSFETTIHQEQDLTPMQKHQYLVSVFRDEML